MTHDQLALQRETFLRIMAELKMDLLEKMGEKLDAARRETVAKLANFRKDMDRKFMWMIAAWSGWWPAWSA